MKDLESRLQDAMRDETAHVTAGPTLADDLVAHGTQARRRRRVAGGVAGLVVVAVMIPVWRTVDHADRSLQPVAPGPSVSTPARPTTSPTTGSHSGTRLPGWQMLPVEVAQAPVRRSQVVDVRVARHATYDRVVVDFAGAVSGYRIDTVPGLVHDGSGRAVRLPGTDKVLVRLTGAAAHDDQGSSVYEGPGRAEYAMPALRGFAFLGDYEGVSLGLGVDSLTTVRVFALASPSRLVIDLHH
jgi:hypothetical protein